MRDAARCVRRLSACIVLGAALLWTGPGLAGADTWTSGGPQGASVNDLALHPSSPRTLYAGTDIGVFKSLDSGESWVQASAGIENDYAGNPYVAALLIDPRNFATLYAGGRAGGSVYKSTDGARTWRKVAALGDGYATAVQALAIDPSNSLTVYAAAPYASNKGVFKTVNGGATWFPINNGLPQAVFCFLGCSVIGTQTPQLLAIDPASPSTLYAGFGSLPGYVSSDAGASWQRRTDPLPWPFSLTWTSYGFEGFAVDPSAPDTVYHAQSVLTDATENETAVVIRRSTDCGATWTVFGNGVRGQYGWTLAVDPTGRFLHLGTRQNPYGTSIRPGNGIFDFEITRPPDPRNRVIPIVLDVATATARYTTELTLTNDTSEPRSVELVYTAALGSQEGSGIVTDRLMPGEQRRIADVLEYLRSKGLAIPDPAIQWSQGGTLQVVAPEPASETGRFSVLARTASDTRPPLPTGRAGLAYGSMQTLPGYSALRIYGLRSSESDRSNLAVVNTSADPMTFRVTVFSGSGDKRSVVVKDCQTLPPYGWTQINSPDLLDQAEITNGWALVERISDLGGLNAYGVVNDHATNDGSFLFPVAAGSYGGPGTVPALVETATFRSELVLTNRSDIDAHLELRYVESLSPERGAGGSVLLTLPAKQQWILPGATDFLRQKGLAIGPAGSGYAGSLQVGMAVSSNYDPLQPYNPPGDAIYVGARTAAQAPGGGEFGLFTPGTVDVATGRAYVYGLAADARNRSNIAVANAQFSLTYPLPVTLRLQVHDGDAGGAPRGNPLKVTLAPGQWKQFDDILTPFGVTNGWVEITTLPGASPGSGDGYWIAYGVINDGRTPGDRTGDGAYVPMTK
jgi:hypothetical protein